MQIKNIQYVISVAEELSFSKAAKKLYVSQPALSQSIKRLENELNVSLFIRDKNNVKLTNAGELFVEEGIKFLNSNENFKNKMMNFVNKKEEKLNIGISPFYSNYYLPKIIPEFKSLHPNIALNIIEENSKSLEKDILNGNLDFCMIPLPLASDEIDYELVRKEQILFALSPNHMLNKHIARNSSNSKLPFLNLQLVKDEPFIFLKKHQKFTKMGMDLCLKSGFTPNIVFETTNWNTIDSMIATGIGVGFVPRILTESYSHNKKPIYYHIMAEHTTRLYVCAYKKGVKLSSVTQDFIRISRKSFSNS